MARGGEDVESAKQMESTSLVSCQMIGTLINESGDDATFGFVLKETSDK